MDKIWILLILTIVCFACGNKKPEGHVLNREEEVKLKRYVAEGRRLYKVHCINCHQKNGEGLGKLYPPLKGADYLLKNPEKSICIMKNGINGPIKVNGVEYNMEMPGVPRLTNLEIAEIISYLYTEMNESPRLFSPNEVAEVLKDCSESN